MGPFFLKSRENAVCQQLALYPETSSPALACSKSSKFQRSLSVCDKLTIASARSETGGVTHCVEMVWLFAGVSVVFD